jgi:uncharacterized protein (DUF2147 family)
MAARISEHRAVAGALLGACAWLLAGAAAAFTPVGTWKTIDDASQRPRSLVEITEDGDALSGRIIRLFVDPGEDPDPRCDKCPGARRDQRVIGMQILWNLRRDGDAWSGGEILDPESGEIYRVTIRPSADGDRLEVRGYIGISLLGRTQVWERAGQPAS